QLFDFLATGLTGGVGLWATWGGGIAVAGCPIAFPIGVVGIGMAGVANGTMRERSAPGSRLRCHPGHIRLATRDMASSNSWPVWKRSSGLFAMACRITCS